MDALLLRWLRLAAGRVAEARERLTDLDAAIGDGDHGINLDRGFRELVRRLDADDLPGEPPAAVLAAAGRVLMGTVGGASGALYGRAFQRAGAALAELDQKEVAGYPVAREARAATALAAAVDAVAALGRATPGEKTMLDALVPARAAYAAALQDGCHPRRRDGTRGRRSGGGRPADDPPAGHEGPGELPRRALHRPPRPGGGLERAPAARPRRRRRRRRRPRRRLTCSPRRR